MTIHRWASRAALGLTLALLATAFGARAAAAQSATEPSAEQLMSEIVGDLDGRSLTVTRLVYPPGASAAEHRHGAYIMAYVVSGHVESALDDEEPVVYGPGEFWYEARMRLHRVFRNPSATEPFTVIVFSVRDAER